jgi:hypothetical protein
LTSLATIANLRATVLVPFNIPTDVDRMPIRLLHMSRELDGWIDGTLVYDERMMGRRTAYEHLEQFFIDFRCDEVWHASELRRMIPNTSGVWSMHPPLLRVYGWVPEPHSFVAICAAFEADTKKDKTLNDKCRDRVLTFIDGHQVTDIVLGDFTHAFP